eukprot:1157016-Pelagomonas_calceolata.AAC.8
MSSRDFAGPSSSSLASSRAACSVKVDAKNPRHQPGQKAGTEVAYWAWLNLPASVCLSMR